MNFDFNFFWSGGDALVLLPPACRSGSGGHPGSGVIQDAKCLGEVVVWVSPFSCWIINLRDLIE